MEKRLAISCFHVEAPFTARIIGEVTSELSRRCDPPTGRGPTDGTHFI